MESLKISEICKKFFKRSMGIFLLRYDIQRFISSIQICQFINLRSYDEFSFTEQCLSIIKLFNC